MVCVCVCVCGCGGLGLNDETDGVKPGLGRSALVDGHFFSEKNGTSRRSSQTQSSQNHIASKQSRMREEAFGTTQGVPVATERKGEDWKRVHGKHISVHSRRQIGTAQLYDDDERGTESCGFGRVYISCASLRQWQRQGPPQGTRNSRMMRVFFPLALAILAVWHSPKRWQVTSKQRRMLS